MSSDNQKKSSNFSYWQLRRQAIIEIGKTIKVKRENCGLTQKQLGEIANVSQSLLSNLESGKIYKEIKLFMLVDIAKIVGAEKEIHWFIDKLLGIQRPSAEDSEPSSYSWQKKNDNTV
jgi:transcriptional regulator with XRE-family HTH domain